MIDLSKIPGTQLDEKTVFFLRKHWFVLLPLIIGFCIILVLPFAVYAVVRMQVPAFFESESTFTLYLLGASIFFLYAWMFLYQNFIDYYLDMWIVTNYRIINIEQKGLFGRSMSELLLYNVQDVTSTVNGFVKTMFDYGDLHIQTAGETERFGFLSVGHPNQIAKRILELAYLRKVESERRAPEAPPGTPSQPAPAAPPKT